jgi:hypothetical protein
MYVPDDALFILIPRLCYALILSTLTVELRIPYSHRILMIHLMLLLLMRVHLVAEALIHSRGGSSIGHESCRAFGPRTGGQGQIVELI